MTLRPTLENNASFWSAIGVVFLLVILTWFSDLIGRGISPEFTSAATSSAVVVNATVATLISCANSATATNFGTLTGVIQTSTPNVSSSISCTNSALGCTLNINDTGSSTTGGGLFASTTNSFIRSPNAAFNATATLVAGTEGYGVQGTTTAAGGGGTLTIAARYFVGGNTFGGLTTTTQILASSSATSSGREVVVTHGAAIASSTPGTTYADTITYSCLAN